MLTNLGILRIDPLLVKAMIPELAFARVGSMRTITVNAVCLMRALCNSLWGGEDRRVGVGVAFAAAGYLPVFFGLVGGVAVWADDGDCSARHRWVAPLPASLIDRNSPVFIGLPDHTKGSAYHDGSPNQGLCMSTCLRVPEVAVDSGSRATCRVVVDARIARQDKVLTERRAPQGFLDRIHCTQFAFSNISVVRNIHDLDIRCGCRKADVQSISLEDGHSQATNDIGRVWMRHLFGVASVPSISISHGENAKIELSTCKCSLSPFDKQVEVAIDLLVVE